MANEDRIFHDEQGRIFYRAPGNRYQEVTADQARVLMEGGGERFVNSIGNTLAQGALGTGALLERVDPFAEQYAQGPSMRDMFNDFADTQATRSQGGPVAAATGALLGYAPDVLLGGKGLVGRVGVREAAQAGLEASARGAVMGAARNPDDPIRGALTEGALGGLGVVGAPLAAAAIRGTRNSALATRFVGTAARVRDSVRPNAQAGWFRPGASPVLPEARAEVRATIAAERAADRARDLSAAATVNPQMGSRPGRLLGDGIHDAETMLDRYSFPLSQGQGDLLNATDTATFTAARELDDEARVRARTDPRLADRIWNGPPTNFAALDRAQQDAIVRETAAQLGMPSELRLLPEKVGTRMTEISDEIEQLLEASPVVRSSGLDAEIARYMTQTRTADPQAVRLLDKYTGQMRDYTDSAGRIDSRNAAKVRNRITKEIEAVGRNAPDTEAVEALSFLRDSVDKRLMADWDDEMRAEYVDLGRKWNLAKALTKGTDAMSARGDVQTGKLLNALKSQDWLTKTGRRSDDFLRFLETVEAVRMRETPDSGTPRGIAQMIASKAADMVPGLGIVM